MCMDTYTNVCLLYTKMSLFYLFIFLGPLLFWCNLLTDAVGLIIVRTV